MLGDRPVWLIAAACLAQVAAMLSFVTFPSLLPLFLLEWSLTNAEAGWISGAYFIGMVLFAPLLVGLTDRVDPKRIVLVGMAVTLLGDLGFALLADGFWSGLVCRAVQGVGFAATYMPGVRALSDAVPERLYSRAVTLFTTTFTGGAGLSFFLSGLVAPQIGWQATFLTFAIGPALGFALVALALPPRPPHAPESAAPRLFDLGPVLRERRALGYMAAGFVHNVESSSMRAFLVALIVFGQALHPDDPMALLDATAAVALANMLGIAGNIAANELAAKLPRRWIVLGIMSLSAMLGVGVGAAVGLSVSLVIVLSCVYALAISADIGSINAGLLQVTAPERRGAAMASYTAVAFTGALVGPAIFGWSLDRAGGETDVGAWALAFLVIAGIVACGVLALWRLGRPPRVAGMSS